MSLRNKTLEPGTTLNEIHAVSAEMERIRIALINMAPKYMPLNVAESFHVPAMFYVGDLPLIPQNLSHAAERQGTTNLIDRLLKAIHVHWATTLGGNS